MFQKKDFGNASIARCVDADDYSADHNGESIDRRGFDGLMLVTSIGVTTTGLDATNHVTIEVQDSDDGTTWADVDGGDIVGDGVSGAVIVDVDTDNTDEDIVRKTAYVGGKRYVRAQVNVHGTVTNLGVSVVGIRTRGIYQ